MIRRWSLAVAFAACLAVDAAAVPVQHHYVDWTSADPGKSWVLGTITLPDMSTVDVRFDIINPDGSPGQFNVVQLTPTDNYWIPSTPYIGDVVANAPATSDVVTLVGGNTQIYKITLSAPIKDPIMPVLSLGSPSVTVEYDFDSPFEILSQGVGYFQGGGANALSKQPGDVLRGREGHGTIGFVGTFSTFSWTAYNFEHWHGFTFGIRTTEALEPSAVPETSAALLGLVPLAMFAGRCVVRQREA